MPEDNRDDALDAAKTRCLAVFGATGGTGRALVAKALELGFGVRAIVHSSEARFSRHPRLSVHRADVVTDLEAVRDAIAGADAVLSTLGARTGRKPTDLYSIGTENICRAMVDHGVRRLCVVSAIPASPLSQKTLSDRFVHALLGLFFGGAYDDLRRMEKNLRARSEIDWTIVRPPRLIDTEHVGEVRMAVEERLAGAKRISRKELAQAILSMIDNPTVIRRAVNMAE